jgi:hypothetical protein
MANGPVFTAAARLSLDTGKMLVSLYFCNDVPEPLAILGSLAAVIAGSPRLLGKAWIPVNHFHLFRSKGKVARN